MKERLTGAIILVALIVLLVPELLTGPIRTRSAPTAPVAAAATFSTRRQPPLRTYTMTLTAATPAQDSLAAPAAQASSAVAGPPARMPDQRVQPQHAAGTAQSEAAAMAPQGSQPPPAAGPGLQGTQTPAHPFVPQARSAGPSGGWVVQLGSFASRQNADRLAHTLSRRGFRMSVSPARAGTRILWRVRAGPAPDRAGAGRLAARLRALGHRGELLPVR